MGLWNLGYILLHLDPHFYRGTPAPALSVGGKVRGKPRRWTWSQRKSSSQGCQISLNKFLYFLYGVSKSTQEGEWRKDMTMIPGCPSRRQTCSCASIRPSLSCHRAIASQRVQALFGGGDWRTHRDLLESCLGVMNINQMTRQSAIEWKWVISFLTQHGRKVF